MKKVFVKKGKEKKRRKEEVKEGKEERRRKEKKIEESGKKFLLLFLLTVNLVRACVRERSIDSRRLSERTR